MAASDDFRATFDKIKCKHDEAFHLVDNAIKQEEEDQSHHALNLYKLAVESIDEALATPVKVPENIDEVQVEWQKACQMVHKIKRTRAEIVQRISALAATSTSAAIRVATNEATCSALDANEPASRPRTYSELAQALQEMKCTGEGIESLELLFSCGGVKLYYIQPNGLVTTALDDSFLRIVRMEKDERKVLSATFFIQIIKTSEAVPIQNVEEVASTANLETNNLHSEQEEAEEAWHTRNVDSFKLKSDNSWIYPLVPGVSPCYRTDFGAFILPDLEATEPGSSFGIIVPKESGTDEIVLEILEGILHGIVVQPSTAPPAEADLSAKISSNIVRGAAFISQNLIRGAEKAGQLVTNSTPYLISKIQPAPENPAPVSKNVQTTVAIAKNVSGTAAGITGYIAGKVGSATMALGRFLAPHIQKHGSTLLSKGFGLEESEAQQKMMDVLTIAAGAVEGFGTIYAGLEQSAVILGKNLSTNSVKIIDHRYGAPTSSLAAETFDTVGNVINLTQNVNNLTVKSIAKRTAKDAGKAIAKEFKPVIPEGGNVVPAGALYPDLTGLQAVIEKTE